MTFREQIRLTVKVGLGVLVGGAVVFGAMYLVGEAGSETVGNVLFYVALGVLAIGALTLVAGIVGRSAHRWVWFNVVKPSTRKVFGRTAAERLLSSPASPVLRLWLHLDREGNDRDGGI